MTLNRSIITVTLLLLKDQNVQQEISEDILRAALVHLDSYITNIIFQATPSCQSYFAFDGESTVIDDACRSMSVVDVESKLIASNEIVNEQMQVRIDTSIAVDHQPSRTAAILAEAFILRQAGKLTKRGKFPFGIQVKCIDCPSVRIHRYTFLLISSSNADMNSESNESIATFEHETTSYLDAFIGDPKIPSASVHALVVTSAPHPKPAGPPIQEASRSNRCEEAWEGTPEAEHYFDTYIVSTYPADLNHTAAKGLKHALESNLLSNILKSNLKSSEVKMFRDICFLGVYPTETSQIQDTLQPTPTLKPALGPPPAVNASQYHQPMDIPFWTRILVTIPFAMLCFFGIVLVILHRRKTKHDLLKVHPLKVEV